MAGVFASFDLLGWVGALLLALLILLIFLAPGGRPKNFPPGLAILPVVGSLLSMPLGPSRELLLNLKKKYGNMASFGLFNKRLVLVSGVSNLKEVFNLRVTSSRPEMIFTTSRNYMVTDGRSGDLGIIGSSGQVWQEQRRFLLHHMRDLGFGKSSYEPVIVEEITELMDHLAQQEGRPVLMRRLFNRSVVNVVWAMLMGKRFPYDHAKLNLLLETFVQPADFNYLAPLHFLPNITRVLHHIPILRQGMLGLKDVDNFLKDEIAELLATEEHKTSNSFISLYLQEIEKRKGTPSNFTMDQLSSMSMEMFIAGMETTASTLTKAVQLLAKHPQVQRRVQEELDEVVGRDRLPTFSDLEQMPYSLATIHEVQRVFNLVTFSLPHATSEDCTLAGYSIPKGTWLLANIEDAHIDPQYWKNPHQFDPQNFLDDEGKYRKNEAFLPFGVGKRLCAGEPLAKFELFLFFTHMFQRFTFTLLEDHGNPVESPVFNAPPEYTVSIHSRPLK